MKKEGTIVALDIGTSKTCVIVGTRGEGTLSVEVVAEAPSRGLRKGLVVDPEAVGASIRAAVREAEKVSGAGIREVSTGVPGNQVQVWESDGVVGVGSGVVSPYDVGRAVDAAKAMYMPLDREIIHVVPVEYTVDGQEGVTNPLGMPCTRLEAKVRLVTVSAADLRGTLRCCAMAGLEVTGLVLRPLASSLAVLSDEEKQHGVVLLDVGAGTTDIAVYEGGVLRHVSVIAIGGNHVTGDIGIVLKLPFDEAERVKREHGAAVARLAGDEEIDVLMAGRERMRIPKRFVSEIVVPRVEEHLRIVSREIRDCGASESATYGIVLTGGAALLGGFDRLCEAVTGMPVRIGVPEGVGGHQEYVREPAYATAVGILLHDRPERDVQSDGSEDCPGSLEKTVSWARGIAEMIRSPGRLQRVSSAIRKTG